MPPHSGARFSPMTGVWLSRCREEHITGPHSCSAEASLQEGPQQMACHSPHKSCVRSHVNHPISFFCWFYAPLSHAHLFRDDRPSAPGIHSPCPPASQAPDLRGRTRSRLTNTQDEDRLIPSRQQREAVVPLGKPLGCHSMRTGAPQSCTPGSRAGWMPEPRTCFGVKEWEGASNRTALPGLLWLMGR